MIINPCFGSTMSWVDRQTQSDLIHYGFSVPELSNTGFEELLFSLEFTNQASENLSVSILESQHTCVKPRRERPSKSNFTKRVLNSFVTSQYS